MKKLLIGTLSLALSFSMIGPGYQALANSNETEEIILQDENEFLNDIGYEDLTIDESYGEDMPDYISSDEPEFQTMFVGAIIRYVVVNGIKYSRHLYKSIKYAPKYPAGFKAVQNGTKNHTVNNKELLSELRQIEAGTWKKVYKDGYKDGKKVSIHYFQSKSGLVYDVKVKSGWSVK